MSLRSESCLKTQVVKEKLDFVINVVSDVIRNSLEAAKNVNR